MPVGKYAQALARDAEINRRQQLNNGTIPGGLAYIAENVFDALKYRQDQRQQQEANAALQEALFGGGDAGGETARFLMPSEQIGRGATSAWQSQNPLVAGGSAPGASPRGLPSSNDFAGAVQNNPMSKLQALAKDGNPYAADFALKLGFQNLSQRQQEQQAARQAAQQDALRQQQWAREDQIRREGFQRDDARFQQEQSFRQQQLEQQNRETWGQPVEMFDQDGAPIIVQQSNLGNWRRVDPSSLMGGQQPQGTAQQTGGVTGGQVTGAAPQPTAPAPSNTYSAQPTQLGQVIDNNTPPEAMTDSIIRQESGGRADAVSPVGARGVMQVMPATAMQPGYGMQNIFDYAEARGIRVPARNEATAKQLLMNPELNQQFGKDYYKQMFGRWGSHMLALASYNAGAGNVENWIKTLGDPRKGEISEVEFVNRIPFQETRNYVTNIANMMTGDPRRVTASAYRRPGEFDGGNASMMAQAQTARGPMPALASEMLLANNMTQPGAFDGGYGSPMMFTAPTAKPALPAWAEEALMGGQPQPAAQPAAPSPAAAPVAATQQGQAPMQPVSATTQPAAQQEPQKRYYTMQKPDLKAQREEAAVAEKQRLANEKAAASYMVVRSDTEDAEKLLDNWFATGNVGMLMSNVGGTDARELSGRYDTIKANISFDTLQEIRAASPTGGALGSVSDREGELLSSAKGKLDIGNSPEVQRQALQRIRGLYHLARTGDYSMLDPRDAQYIREGRGEAEPTSTPQGSGATAQGASSLPTVASNDDAAFDALPSGAEFVDETGKRWRKP